MHPSSPDYPASAVLADVDGDGHRSSAPKTPEPAVVVVVVVVVAPRMHMSSNLAQHRRLAREQHKRSKL